MASERLKFFISYNHADRDWAEWTAWQLEATGHTAVIQAWDFHPYENFVIEMQRSPQEPDRTISVPLRIPGEIPRLSPPSNGDSNIRFLGASPPTLKVLRQANRLCSL